MEPCNLFSSIVHRQAYGGKKVQKTIESQLARNIFSTQTILDPLLPFPTHLHRCKDFVVLTQGKYIALWNIFEGKSLWRIEVPFDGFPTDLLVNKHEGVVRTYKVRNGVHIKFFLYGKETASITLYEEIKTFILTENFLFGLSIRQLYQWDLSGNLIGLLPIDNVGNIISNDKKLVICSPLLFASPNVKILSLDLNSQLHQIFEIKFLEFSTIQIMTIHENSLILGLRSKSNFYISIFNLLNGKMEIEHPLPKGYGNFKDLVVKENKAFYLLKRDTLYSLYSIDLSDGTAHHIYNFTDSLVTKPNLSLSGNNLVLCYGKNNQHMIIIDTSTNTIVRKKTYKGVRAFPMSFESGVLSVPCFKPFDDEWYFSITTENYISLSPKIEDFNVDTR